MFVKTIFVELKPTKTKKLGNNLFILYFECFLHVVLFVFIVIFLVIRVIGWASVINAAISNAKFQNFLCVGMNGPKKQNKTNKDKQTKHTPEHQVTFLLLWDLFLSHVDEGGIICGFLWVTSNTDAVKCFLWWFIEQLSNTTSNQERSDSVVTSVFNLSSQK